MNEKLRLLNEVTYKYCSYKVYLHQNRVVKNSVKLFENLKELTLLDKEDEEILIISAQIHDIGKCINKKHHHKHSSDIIIGADEIDEIIGDIKEAVAAVAYSHRKKIYEDIFLLEEIVREKILSVISILRIADALDYYEEESIKITNIQVYNRVAYIGINKRFNVEATSRFNEKKKLFEELTHIKLYLVK